MLRLGAVVLHVSDVDRAAAFWSAALGYQPGSSDPAFLAPGDAAPGPRLHLDEDDRTHLDLWADDPADQQVQVERLVRWVPGGSTGTIPTTRTSWCWPTPTAPCSA